MTVSSLVQYVLQGFLYDTRKYPKGIVFSGLRDMSSYRIGVLFSSGIMRYLQKGQDLRLETNLTHEGSAKQLQMGRIDVWAIVDLTGLMYIQKLFPDEAPYFRNTHPFNKGDISVVCLLKRDPAGDYSRRFREGLAKIKKDGTYMRIMAQYYGGKERINPEALPDDMR